MAHSTLFSPQPQAVVHVRPLEINISKTFVAKQLQGVAWRDQVKVKLLDIPHMEEFGPPLPWKTTHVTATSSAIAAGLAIAVLLACAAFWLCRCCWGRRASSSATTSVVVTGAEPAETAGRPLLGNANGLHTLPEEPGPPGYDVRSPGQTRRTSPAARATPSAPAGVYTELVDSCPCCQCSHFRLRTRGIVTHYRRRRARCPPRQPWTRRRACKHDRPAGGSRAVTRRCHLARGRGRSQPPPAPIHTHT